MEKGKLESNPCMVLRGISVGPHYEEGIARLLLQEREEHCGFLVLGQGLVLAVFDNPDDLSPRITVELEVSADGFVHRSEDCDGKLAIDERNNRRFFIIGEGKVSACEQRGAGRFQIVRGDFEVHCFRGMVGGPEIGCAVGEDIGVVSAGAERHVIDISSRRDAGNRLGCIDHAELHLCGAVAGVACHIQLALHQHCVLGCKAEIAMQRAHQATHRHQRRGDEHRADGNLHDQQNVSQGKAPVAGHTCGACAHDLPWVGAHDLAEWHDAEEEAAAQRQYQRNNVRGCVRIHRHVDGNIRNGLPCTEHAQDDNASRHSQRSSYNRYEKSLGEHLAKNEATL
jgi:hypothetical protein